MQRLLQQDARLYSTFRLPAVLHEVLLCHSVEQLNQYDETVPPLLLGEGSNSIFLTDIHRPILRYVADSITELVQADGVLLHVEAGHNWHALVSYTVQQGWWGLENLALIPGSVGAAPVQNIGAYGVELMDCCAYVDFYHWHSKTVQRLSKQECLFAYRDSIFKHQLADQGVIIAVGFQLHFGGKAKLSYRGLDHLASNCGVEDVYHAVMAVRNSKLPDPTTLSNCGSFFKNPIIAMTLFQSLQQQFPQLPQYVQDNGQVKTAAAWLIEQCGFKGQQYGDIGCYALQPLVLVNYGEGTAAQLKHWVEKIISTVDATFGIQLEPEVRMLHEC